MPEQTRKTHVRGQKLTKDLHEAEVEIQSLERASKRRLNTNKMLGKEVFDSGTVLSSVAAKKENYTGHLTAPKIDDNVDEEKFQAFAEMHQDILGRWVDELADRPIHHSANYLLQHPDILLSSDCETFCMFHCLGLQLEGKVSRMEKSARQYMLVQHALQLSRAVSGVSTSKGSVAKEAEQTKPILLNRKATEQMLETLEDNPELKKEFDKSVEEFVGKVKARAALKSEEDPIFRTATASRGGNGGPSSPSTGSKNIDRRSLGSGPEEEFNREFDDDVEARREVGPGGLNAQKVFDELPESLQDAFVEKDAVRLQAAFDALPRSEAHMWMQKCIAGGLWVLPGQ